MSRISICLKLHLIIAGILIGWQVHGAEPAAGDVNKHVVPGQFFVRFAPASALAAANELEKAGNRFQKRIDIVAAELWTFPMERNVSDVLKEVKAIPGVVAVEPVYMCYLHDDYPNDGADQWALPAMDVVQSWQFVEDSDAIVVAMIDTGIVPNHPDLQGRITAGRDFVGAEPDPPNHNPDDNPTDYYGHGTMTSGIIGAIIDNNTGISGAVPNVLIMPLKVSADTAGGSLEPSVLPDAMQWAVDNGASVVNASYGSPYHQHFVRETIQKMQDAGILFVASAGNDGTDNDDPDFSQTPCSFNLANIIGVMATDVSDLQASFSSYGRMAVDLGAPGVNIKSTYLLSSSGYAARNGTSFSAPYVSGLAACLRQLHPDISVRELRLMILEGADPLGSLKGKCVTEGRANYFRTMTVPPPRTLEGYEAAYNPAEDIPDDETPLTKSITVNDDVFIRAVSVSVTIEHARIEDLEIDITSPDEITVPILWRSGGALDPNETKVNWPSGQEYVFDTQWEFRGKQSSGQWTLTVRDMVSGDTGKLESWRLEIHTYREADESKRGGGILCTNSSRIAVKNSIIWGNAAPTGRGPQAAIGSSEFPSVLKVTYSDIEGGADDVYCGSEPCGSETLVWGEGNIDSDPLFSATQGDYHVKSVYGRWNPASQSWVTDQESSPCLDGGDPAYRPEYEPEPAGFRINMGGYGNTPKASMAKWLLPGDANGDCIVDVRDLIAIKNHLMQSPSTGDLWKYDVNQDNNINVLDLLYVRARLGNECQ